MDWEISEIIEPVDWWEVEHWVIRSTGKNWGFKVWISFMSCDGESFSKRVDAIAASCTKPTYFQATEQTIAELCMMKGEFEEKKAAFLTAIELHRETDDLQAGNI
jgi:hypothetical protein